jgi:Ribbon-helix-helix protein, copG family
MTATATATAPVPLVYPGILRNVPKVMVSMPDELLAEVDAEAKRTGSTRSAVLRGFAHAAIQRRRAHRAAEMRKAVRHAGPQAGGDVAELIKATRPKH